MMASTDWMQALRKPFSSSAVTPQMVVPAGQQTLSLRTPGCVPVASCSFAEPRIIWEMSR